ncbi:MAG TPA: prolyl oligopeptidase family serine peptidase, partial [Steroidobacteraceae bacterium]|nr:prolyl oligopeptidase family serine peptidase [Steroidobacteraceae bacterium]
MPRRFRTLFVINGLLAGCLALTACGGGNNDDEPGISNPPPPSGPARGALIESPPAKLNSYSPATLLGLLGGNDVGKALLQLAVSPPCSVDVYQLKYGTVGAKAEATSASGALMVPNGTDAACSGPRPILLYAHGTSPDRAYNIADLMDTDNTEGLAIAAVFAGQGYIVVAPNYAGYDSSSLTYHPYLNADQQSKDMIDALTAARAGLPGTSAGTVTTDSGKLFVTGYSQGGYVAMATHKALQAAGTTVTASAPMSGPYALSAFGDAIFEGNVSESAPVNLTLLINSYQQAYGNIYTATTDVFEAKYATGIDTLLPSATGLGDLETQGKIPASETFSLTPPAPEFAAFTPSTTPAQFAAVFAAGFGANNLITNAYRLTYLTDAQTAPDGGFPASTDGLPPANPTQKLRVALKTNDLRTWTPNAPVLLCGGNNDPTVFYFNTELMQSYWTTNVPTGAVTVLDVDSAVTSGDLYSNIKTAFSAAKDLVRTAAVVGGASDGG